MSKQKCAEGKRICVTCKVELPLTNEFFSKDKNRAAGLMYRCKDCDRKRPDDRTWKTRKEKMTKEELRDHYDKSKIRNKKYSKTPKGKAMFITSQYKNRDKGKGHENDLTQKDVLLFFATPCFYCGHPSTGADRIDNSKGHTKSNCVPCCKECNVARMDNFSHEEMKIIGRVIRRVKNQRIGKQ